MSAKKNEAEAVENVDAVDVENVDAVEQKEKTVKILIPIERNGDNSDVFVSVNERTWLIQRGVEVEVPECVLEVLRHRDEMYKVAYDFENSVKSKD